MNAWMILIGIWAVIGLYVQLEWHSLRNMRVVNGNLVKINPPISRGYHGQNTRQRS